MLVGAAAMRCVHIHAGIIPGRYSIRVCAGFAGIQSNLYAPAVLQSQVFHSKNRRPARVGDFFGGLCVVGCAFTAMIFRILLSGC